MGVLSAQTPAETKLYNKTLKKPSVKAYDKFLNKYPQSVYSLEILTLRALRPSRHSPRSILPLRLPGR